MDLAALEQNVIKDNTLLPGEWVGGQLHIEPPQNEAAGATKTYVVTVLVGDEIHEITVAQGNTA